MHEVNWVSLLVFLKLFLSLGLKLKATPFLDRASSLHFANDLILAKAITFNFDRWHIATKKYSFFFLSEILVHSWHSLWTKYWNVIDNTTQNINKFIGTCKPGIEMNNCTFSSNDFSLLIRLIIIVLKLYTRIHTQQHSEKWKHTRVKDKWSLQFDHRRDSMAFDKLCSIIPHTSCFRWCKHPLCIQFDHKTLGWTVSHWTA